MMVLVLVVNVPTALFGRGRAAGPVVCVQEGVHDTTCACDEMR